jgi:cell division protein FtsI/penicillin-binding protein 2
VRRAVPLLAFALSSSLLASCSTGAALPSPSPTAEHFVALWQAKDWPAMETIVLGHPAGFVADNEGELTGLGVTAGRFQVDGVVQHGAKATAAVTETFRVPTLGPLVIHSVVELRLRGRRWKVRWSPETIDPELAAGDHFSTTVTWAPRAPILYADGSVLASVQATGVEIGIQGAFVKNVPKLEKALLDAGASKSAIDTALAASRTSPDAFEPVLQVSEARYEQLKPMIYPIPGTVFRTTGGGTTPPPALAAVVGSLGTITKAELKALGPPYDASSIVGQGGIEQAEQTTLAGTPGGTVTIVGANGSVKATLLRLAPRPGTSVRTSIVPRIESIASSALSTLTSNEAAIVLMNASTGQVLAAANNLLGTADLALDGAQPPGSTFKMITSTALIEHGLTPSSPATCPKVINVDGENLHNASPTDVANNLLEAFTISCNTAFIGLTMANLDYSSLHDAAAQYGIGTTPRLGAVAFGGSVPVAVGQTDLAASAIGQSRVVLNPLNLATVAAAVDTGIVHRPRLVTGAPDDSAPTHKLPSDVVRYLHQMMLSVVESGTASGTGLPPGTYAKTGTAQYGTGPTLPIDGWLAGFNGNIAFAMVVINSPKDGGPEDGPIVAQILDALHAGG